MLGLAPTRKAIKETFCQPYNHQSLKGIQKETTSEEHVEQKAVRATRSSGMVQEDKIHAEPPFLNQGGRGEEELRWTARL